MDEDQEKYHQTKEDVLYGNFVENDSDSKGGSHKNKRRKDLFNKQDLTKPLNFVSKGVVMPCQEIDQNSISKNRKDNQDEGSMSGISFGALGSTRSDFGSKNKNGNEKEVVNDTSVDFRPTALGKQFKKRVIQRREDMDKSKLNKKLSQVRLGIGEMKDEGNLGIFENHTKGIGSKLLEKMGYKGGGLGKYAQGIVAPVEPKLRPKNMGIGYNNKYKETVNLPVLQESFDQNQVISKSQLKEKMWSKQGRSKNKKKEYVTAEELLVKKQEQGLDVVQKVIDMRGPQVRVLTNLENLNADVELRDDDDVPMPEFQHNVRLILDSAELDVRKLDQQLRKERETVVTLQKQKEKLKLKHEVDRQKQQLANIEEIVTIVEQLDHEGQTGTLTLDAFAKLFMNLQKRFPNEYKLGSLSKTAFSFALPLFSKEFQSWDPLKDPENHLNVVSVWKDLLQEDEIFDLLYTHFFMEVVFPVVRRSITNTWQPCDPKPLLIFLDFWENLMPHQVIETILDNIVMPKLSAAVNSWDPVCKHVAIHKWFHPWLPLFGQKLETLYPVIRNRLERVLRVWHPSDESAYVILSPWKPVFDSKSWEKLLVRFIVPKLLAVMYEFQINPVDQKVDQFCWVLTWADVIPVHLMVNIMDVFFTKWLEVLHQWLCSKPDFEEVSNWFLGWKNLLPAELASDEHIRVWLHAGLEMMNQAAQGLEPVQLRVRENISGLKARKHRRSQADDTGGVVDLILKEVVEIHAQRNNLLFKPKPGRMQDGHQLYGFGNISVIIDSFNQKVFAQIDDRWSLVSLEQLVDLEKSFVKKRR